MYLSLIVCCSIVSSRHQTKKWKKNGAIVWCKQVFTHHSVHVRQLYKWMRPITDREASDRVWRRSVNKNFISSVHSIKTRQKPREEVKEDVIHGDDRTRILQTKEKNRELLQSAYQGGTSQAQPGEGCVIRCWSHVTSSLSTATWRRTSASLCPTTNVLARIYLILFYRPPFCLFVSFFLGAQFSRDAMFGLLHIGKHRSHIASRHCWRFSEKMSSTH